ncbi:MAG: hypothetical protein WA885_12830 [Phormidesmis sp.]
MSETAKASLQGLAIVKQAIAQRGWRKTSPAFLDKACVSAATLKRFWRGVPIGQDSFEAICQAVNVNAAQIAQPQITQPQIAQIQTTQIQTAQPSQPSALTYDDLWVGRSALVSQLRAQIKGTTRLLCLSGLTGIGKTALARYVASGLTDYVCIHLTCELEDPPTLAAIAHALPQPAHKSHLILNPYELLDHLRVHPYLLIIDGLEQLLDSDPATGWSSFKGKIWNSFFQTILTAKQCKSRFILTCQNRPNELEIVGERYPTRWCLQHVAGLPEDEQIELFQQMGLACQPQSQAREYLSHIGALYDGHPLSLQVIARDITLSFDGNVVAYWNEYEPYLQTLSFNLHNHSRMLGEQLQPKLERTLAQLQRQLPEAYTLLQSGCQYSVPKPSYVWLQNLFAKSLPQRFLLDALCDRALLMPSILNNRIHFHLHPLVRSVLIPR